MPKARCRRVGTGTPVRALLLEPLRIRKQELWHKVRLNMSPNLTESVAEEEALRWFEELDDRKAPADTQAKLPKAAEAEPEYDPSKS